MKFAEMVWEIIMRFDGRFFGQALHHRTWGTKVTVGPLFLILRKYEAYYVHIFGRHYNLQDEHHRYTTKPETHTLNRMISRILGRAGITVRAKTKSSPPRMIQCAESLCVCKALVQPEHFQCYRYLVSKELWNDVERLWQANSMNIRQSYVK
ncbi:hypothetical protein K450DRAFT_262912 [Umbelopsis ramanniana AG]|uniref:Uncharacterized protein n=1 Tax=Umbelopsis ramanniana AG TaxID=1314678 RepID=A0AAD5E1D3_UMBRA|nr:uncharacterized protein K450DRAFT_262912 [Umbelopsis ramanniana AG]KAI8575212.1 hypothetical protein K450DRAFT_262912 [Umbelopsis ramanniana AG]